MNWYWKTFHLPFLNSGCTLVCATLYVDWNLSGLVNECLPTITRKSRLVFRWRQWAAVNTTFFDIIAPPQWCCHVFESACKVWISTWRDLMWNYWTRKAHLSFSYLPRIRAVRSRSTAYYFGRRSIGTHLFGLVLYGAASAIQTFVHVRRRRICENIRRSRETPAHQNRWFQIEKNAFNRNDYCTYS